MIKMDTRFLLISGNRWMRFLILLPFIATLFVILACALASPYFESNLMVGPYNLVTSFLGKICHQYPSRCFYLLGSNIGLCARCFCMYLTVFFALFVFVYIELTLRPKFVVVAACFLCAPLLFDGITQYWGLRESNNWLRLLTGFGAGVGISILLIPFYIRIISVLVRICFTQKFHEEGNAMKIKTQKVLISIFLATALMQLPLLCYAAEVMVKAGTPIPVRLEDAISSETATAGQSVRFTVTRDVAVDDKVVVSAGSEVVGEVTFSQKTGSLGKEGKVFLVVRYATAVDNTRLPLRANLSQEGDEKVALSWMVCPFIKGTSSMIPAGTETKAYVDYDTKVKVP